MTGKHLARAEALAPRAQCVPCANCSSFDWASFWFQSMVQAGSMPNREWNERRSRCAAKARWLRNAC